MPDQDRPHRAWRHHKADAVQFTDDPLVAPAWVLPGEPDDEPLDLGVHRRPSDPSRRVRPATCHQPLVPTKQRPRTHHEHRPRSSRQHATHRRQQHPISLPKLGPLRVTPQDRELMPQHHDLERLSRKPFCRRGPIPTISLGRVVESGGGRGVIQLRCVRPGAGLSPPAEPERVAAGGSSRLVSDRRGRGDEPRRVSG